MQLVFVYNADSGLMNTVKDIGHKLFNPGTYDCFLCSLTHGTFRENTKWKRFREQTKSEMLFLHRDEFEERFGVKQKYPVVLKWEKGTEQLEVVLSRRQLAGMGSLEELIAAVQGLEAG